MSRQSCPWGARVEFRPGAILVLSVAALFLAMLVGVLATTILPHWSTPLFFIVSDFVATCWLVAPCFSGYRRRR